MYDKIHYNIKNLKKKKDNNNNKKEGHTFPQSITYLAYGDTKRSSKYIKLSLNSLSPL